MTRFAHTPDKVVNVHGSAHGLVRKIPDDADSTTFSDHRRGSRRAGILLRPHQSNHREPSHFIRNGAAGARKG